MRVRLFGQHRVLIGFVLGIALLVAVFARQDFAGILAATRMVGAGLALIVGWRLVSLALIALGWRQLFDARDRPLVIRAMLARWICEAVNTLLPVAQVGGEIARGRIITRWAALPASIAVATIIVDMTLNLAGQFVLALVGAWHVWRTGERAPLELAVACLAALVPLILLAIAQTPAVLNRAHRGFARLTGNAPVAGSALAAGVRAVYGRGAGLSSAVCFHLVAAFSRVVEGWIVLRLMGSAIGVGDAVMVEGLSAALRTAAFLLPAGLGVQEGALLVLCGWIGVPPSQALALALIKRAREIAVGSAGLLVWLGLERSWRVK